MSKSLTPSIQDYLKAIYALAAEGEASTSALAARLGVAPASVTGMLQRLAATNPPLIVYRKHRGVALTPGGERAALEVIRHHRLIETYLVNALGYSWDAVHEEACRLEHVISEDFEERIAAALGHPARDPHGEPIPSRDLSMPPATATPLSDLHAGQTAVLQRVRPAEAALLRHLASLGLLPGARLQVLDRSTFDGNLRLRIHKNAQAAVRGSADAAENGEIVVLGPAITRHIFVEVI